MALPFRDTRCAIRTSQISMPVVVLRAYQRACCLCQVLCLLIVNVGAATSRLVTSLYRTVSPRKVVSSPVEVTDIYIFRNKGFFSSRGFLDIEKSVLLELKGVKVIRSYNDFFQLIRDFFQLIIHFVFFI